jgi:CubicO group peptidase (beta-lactamase class C family)
MTGLSTFRPAALDAVIDAATPHRVVGAVVMASIDGEVVYARAAGYADREAERAMTPDGIFMYSSVTKPLVSLAALRMVEAGELSLDAPVTDWLPGFRPALPEGRRPAITLGHLLSHTAGLSYRFMEGADGPYHRLGVSTGFDAATDTLAGVLARLAGAPLLYPPGEGWGYSMATDVVGAVIAAAAGKPLPQAVDELIVTPLGLADTGFHIVDPRRAVVHYGDDEPVPVRMKDRHDVPFLGTPVEFAPNRLRDPNAWPSAGAGMAGSAGDAMVMLEALRTGGGILRPESVLMAHSLRHLPDAGTNGPGWGFGLASAVLADPSAAASPQSRGSLAWNGAFGHSWFIDPERGLTVAALTNTAFEGMAGRFPIEIRDAVYAGLGA